MQVSPHILLGCRQAVRHGTLTPAFRWFKSNYPSQKKALAQASAFFNEARLTAHEASCAATREAGLRPMKRAFGTRKGYRALRFTATKLPLHTSRRLVLHIAARRCIISNIQGFALIYLRKCDIINSPINKNLTESM